MNRTHIIAAILVAALGTPVAHAIMPPSIFHDPYLNWDFINHTGSSVNDLEIVVDDPAFSPNLTDPDEARSDVFANVTIYNTDHDGNGDQDTVVRFHNGLVSPGQRANGGLFMAGSGNILDAYWTLDGAKVGPSLPTTYELTEIRGDSEIEVHMQLQLGDMFFDDLGNSGLVAGWTNVRTFVNIPAAWLDLPDINSDLDEASLAGFSVQPYRGRPGIPGNTGVPILPSDTFLFGDFAPDSFFDVFLAEILPPYKGPNYESLLIADVIVAAANDPTHYTVVGGFWNLNPQSPEPATLAMLTLGGLGLLRGRRRFGAPGPILSGRERRK